ncbi:MAG TPA: ABC transporter ATP-binding protein, partial [Polyangiaceae bacterium]|nr:ABC transporter ATP-binding protein [Polyangiaceae bacterium]
GKSVTAQSILRLIQPPGRIVGGSIRIHGKAGEAPLEVLEEAEDSEALYELRGGRAALIFQEATAALSPVHSIGHQILESILTHRRRLSKAGRRLRQRDAERIAIQLLGRVGIVDPELCMRQYPHELSGGMRQRALIAMALVTEPELLIADEPTTALDARIQAQILALLKQLQARLALSILLITHDLGVVAQMADEVAVMYLGRIVESGSVRGVLKKPRHPYTMGLIASLPSSTPIGQPLPNIPGTVPALSDVPQGCPFHPRCSHALPGRCNTGTPPPLERFGAASAGPPPDTRRLASQPPALADDRSVACFRVRDIALERLLRGSEAPPGDARPSLAPPSDAARTEGNRRDPDGEALPSERVSA